MSKNYKKYDEEFKKTLVALHESGKKISELEREYGINESSIRTWIKKYGTIASSTGEITNNDEIINYPAASCGVFKGITLIVNAVAYTDFLFLDFSHIR